MLTHMLGSAVVISSINYFLTFFWQLIMSYTALPMCMQHHGMTASPTVIVPHKDIHYKRVASECACNCLQMLG